MFDRPPKVKIEAKTTPEYSPDDMSFEAQYSRKKQLEINGADVDTVSITPENKKTDVPVFVLHGWGANMDSFEPAMKVLAEKGRPVMSLDFPRKGGELPDWYNKDIAEWYETNGIENPVPSWPKEFLRESNTLYELIKNNKTEKADMVAHSMGGIVAVMTAMMHPEKFAGRTIILTNSAGLIGKDSFSRLQKGAGANKSRTETVSGIPVTKEEIDYLDSTKNITNEYIGLDNPLKNIKKILRAGKEVWSISQFQITEDMLRYLKDKGIKVIVASAVEDTMFPMEGMQKNVPGGEVAGFVSMRGGHMQIQVNSKEFMSGLETMLPQPEKKS
jgi:pimeloyl-ACP methyl ester carboxylesterase